MSYNDPEEDLLDQHLREAFSEFKLPPARQVWKGIEGRIGVLPGAVQPLLPLKFLLPVIALAGVAAGWLLPQPTSVRPAAHLAATYVGPSQITRSAASMMAVVVPVNAAPASSVPEAAASIGRRISAGPGQTAQRPAAVEPLPPQPVVLAAAEPNSIAVRQFAADSSAPVSQNTTPPSGAASATQAVAVAETVAGTAQSIETPKPLGQHGFHAEFRQPTHRRAEQGRGIRRRLAAVGQWARRLVSPRRVRTTGQPNF